MMTIGGYVELLKPRIGMMIALTAVVAHVAMVESVEPLPLFLLVVVMFLGSAGSAVFNHYYDRDIDRRMTRTAQRPLARGAMDHPAFSLVLAGGLVILGVGLATYFFNPVTALHVFMGAFFYGVVYTVWLKRRSWLNIVLGGLSGSFAILAGASSVDPELCALPLLLALVLFLWTPTHFWSLAIFLKEEYRKVGVPMLPVLVGEKRTAWVILGNSLLLVGSSLLPWWLGEMGAIYAVGAFLAGGLLLWENWRLVREPTTALAWSNFIGSMRYLGLLFLVIVADSHLSWAGF